jgi:hypothetical protein
MPYFVRANKGKTELKIGIRTETEDSAKRMKQRFIDFGWNSVGYYYAAS